jgi:hypothetical protein
MCQPEYIYAILCIEDQDSSLWRPTLDSETRSNKERPAGRCWWRPGFSWSLQGAFIGWRAREIELSALVRKLGIETDTDLVFRNDPLAPSCPDVLLFE